MTVLVLMLQTDNGGETVNGTQFVEERQRICTGKGIGADGLLDHVTLNRRYVTPPATFSRCIFQFNGTLGGGSMAPVST